MRHAYLQRHLARYLLPLAPASQTPSFSYSYSFSFSSGSTDWHVIATLCIASSIPPTVPCPLALPVCFHSALNLLHLLASSSSSSSLLICHSCETLKSRKASPACLAEEEAEAKNSGRSHKIMIGIFAGNLNCLLAWLCYFSLAFFMYFVFFLFFSFNYLQFSFSTRFLVYFMQHLRCLTWKFARNSTAKITVSFQTLPSRSFSDWR